MTLPLPSSPHWPPTRMMTKALLGSRLGPPRLQVIEAGVVAAELELDHPGRAVAVLGHDHLGNAWFLVGLVVLGAEKEGDDVRVLLDTSAFAKVAQDRALVWTLLWGAAQLRDRDYRNAKLASKTFQRTRDGRDLLHPIVVTSRTTVHELQIVDEDHVDVVTHLGLTSFQLECQLIHHGGVVDVDRRLTQRP